jgi:hypothetical protein
MKGLLFQHWIGFPIAVMVVVMMAVVIYWQQDQMMGKYLYGGLQGFDKIGNWSLYDYLFIVSSIFNIHINVSVLHCLRFECWA